jgi:hypothetical protein
MLVVEESIPEALLPEVEASLAWFNRHEDATFEVTGILNPDEALGTSGPRALRLILCGGDRCEQRSFRVDQDGEDYAVSFLDDTSVVTADTPVPELDPPPGARRNWLDNMLGRHSFTVLVFYRGFW